MMRLNYYSYCVGAKVIELDNLKHGFWLGDDAHKASYWYKFMETHHKKKDRSLTWIENVNLYLAPYNAHIVFFADRPIHPDEYDWEDSQLFVKFATAQDYAMFLLKWS